MVPWWPMKCRRRGCNDSEWERRWKVEKQNLKKRLQGKNYSIKFANLMRMLKTEEKKILKKSLSKILVCHGLKMIRQSSLCSDCKKNICVFSRFGILLLIFWHEVKISPKCCQLNSNCVTSMLSFIISDFKSSKENYNYTGSHCPTQ